MTVIAVIPARGGSKGVPGKNVAPVAGRTLIERAVTAARRAQQVDRIVVSTDDDSISSAARSAGAEVLARPAELAGDGATSESAMLHVLDSIGAAPDDIVLLVQCTSPFVTAEDIDAVVAPVAAGRADSTFTAARSHGFLWRPDGTGINHDPTARQRRQERPVELVETGAAYAMRCAELRAGGHRFSGRVLPVEVDSARTLEVDEPADLDRARALAPLLDGARSWPRRGDVDALVLDFDGTLTDDRVYLDQDGRESVTVHRGDGMGVALLLDAGLRILILSSEANPVVAARARKLGVPALHGVKAKEPALTQWCAEQRIALARTAYVGNDVNDLPCLQIVGWPIAVADAHHAVRAHARIVTSAVGGSGVVREIASALLERDVRDGHEPPSLHR
jgi:YrbI family 3-deoxy-D-manno-octulosonate 8-phosphate phosphatase